MLYVLRHGETEWNRIGRFQGQLDSPLTERGKAQASAMGRLLGQCLLEPVATPVWSSPLGRARQSCELVCAAAGIPGDRVREDAALMEVNFGAWEGIDATEAAKRDRAAYDLRNRDKFHNRFPGGECYHDVFMRVSRWVAGLDCDRETVAVAHGSLNRTLVAAATGIPPQRCLEEVPMHQDAILVVGRCGWEVVETDASRNSSD